VTKAAPRKAIRYRSLTQLIGMALVVILAVGFSSALQLFWSVDAHAADLCPTNPNVKDLCASPTDKCLQAALKVNLTPLDPTINHRVLELVNCSTKATLLGASNAAQNKGSAPTSVLPREGTWEMAPFDPGDTQHLNVLVIDVPPAWENTKCGHTQREREECEKNGVVGPRVWGRTGCRYDVNFDWAQCETGGCSGRYDCSAAKQNSSTGTTVSEWTLYEPVKSGSGDISYFKDSPDISAVDGVSINMDIRPVGGCPRNPFDYVDLTRIYDAGWINQNCPLVVYGEDLRGLDSAGNPRCTPANFQFKRSDLTGKATPDYRFVEVDKNGNPIGGDSTIGCFSNCGRYAWPTAPAINCPDLPQSPLPTDNKLTVAQRSTRCYRWKVLCAGDPANYTPTYQTVCGTGDNPDNYDDSLCPALGSCWYNPGSVDTNGRCNARAFIKNPDPKYADNGGCDPAVCTFPYLFKNPITYPITKRPDYSTQPPFGHCSDLPGADACIGDDTMHQVMRKAYTWPNDPQVYGGNADAYQIVLAPGDTKASITASGPVPFCDDAVFQGAPYQYASQHTLCKNSIDYGAIFNVAKPVSGTNLWSCDIDPTGSGNEGVLCRWRESIQRPIYQVGLRVNASAAVQTLELGVIPGIQNGDLLVASITYLDGATPTPPAGWTQVPNANIASKSANDRTTVWYHIAKNEPSSYTWKWNSNAYPAGAITFWRGVDNARPFDDIQAQPDTGTGAFATAPSITTKTANSQLLSIFGAGNGGRLAFQGPVSVKPNIGRDEAMAAKLIGGIGVAGTDTWYGHLVGDRPQTGIGPADAQRVEIIPNPDSGIIRGGLDWTAISIVLKPGPMVTPTATATATPKSTPTPTPKFTATPTPKPSTTRTPTPTPTAKAGIVALCGATAQGAKDAKSLAIKVCDPASGNVYIASISSDDAATITAPSGWTQIGQTDVSPRLFVTTFWHRSSGSEPATYTWMCDDTCYPAGGIEAYSGVAASGSPIDKTSSNFSVTAASPETALSVTTTKANDYVIATCGDSLSAAGTWSTGTQRWLLPFSAGNYYMNTYTDKPGPAAPGATGNITFKGATASYWGCQQITLLPK
jgi:hypothetical protein